MSTPLANRPGPRDPVARWQTYANYLEAKNEQLRKALVVIEDVTNESVLRDIASRALDGYAR